jgi:hypothetical protein
MVTKRQKARMGIRKFLPDQLAALQRLTRAMKDMTETIGNFPSDGHWVAGDLAIIEEAKKEAGRLVRECTAFIGVFEGKK